MDEVLETDIPSVTQVVEKIQKSSVEENYRRVRSDLVNRFGLALGILKSIEKFGGKLERHLDSEETQEILNKEPVLLVGTHNWGYEVLSAVGGLPEGSNQNEFRKVKLVSEASPQVSWLTKHSLPLYNVSNESSQRFAAKIRNQIQPPNVIERSKATILNASTLREAGQEVAGGGLVLICPEGKRNKNEKWQKGVAAIVKVAKNGLQQQNKEGYVVMVSVEGVGFKNYLIDKAADYFTKMSPYKDIKVRYSKPIPISTINTDVSGDEIVEDLEMRYRNWLKTPRLSSKEE